MIDTPASFNKFMKADEQEESETCTAETGVGSGIAAPLLSIQTLAPIVILPARCQHASLLPLDLPTPSRDSARRPLLSPKTVTSCRGVNSCRIREGLNKTMTMMLGANFDQQEELHGERSANAVHRYTLSSEQKKTGELLGEAEALRGKLREIEAYRRTVFSLFGTSWHDRVRRRWRNGRKS